MASRKPVATELKKATKFPAKPHASNAPVKKSAAKKSAVKKFTLKKAATSPSRKRSAKVDTVSTHPDQGLFLKSASEIAKALTTKRVSPGGPTSGMRMLTFYINRAGKNLPKSRAATLEHAKELLSAVIAKQRSKPPAKAIAKKSSGKRSAKKSTSPAKN